MSVRKVHLRTQGAVNLGSSKTYCGRVIYWAPRDMSGAVVDFANFDATVHGTLVTCARCLLGTYRRIPASAMSAGTAETQSGSGLQPASAVAATSGETPNTSENPHD